MNDVFKEQEPVFLKLTDSAEALLQALEGLVMILDVQGKVLDSNSSSVAEIHPLHIVALVPRLLMPVQIVFHHLNIQLLME